MKEISLTREQREKAMISDCEGMILMILYNFDDGMPSAELKKLVIALIDPLLTRVSTHSGGMYATS